MHVASEENTPIGVGGGHRLGGYVYILNTSEVLPLNVKYKRIKKSEISEVLILMIKEY